MEVHAKAIMIADLATIMEMLYEVLPEILAGASVEQMKRPWPKGFDKTGSTGLWWDK